MKKHKKLGLKKIKIASINNHLSLFGGRTVECNTVGGNYVETCACVITDTCPPTEDTCQSNPDPGHSCSGNTRNESDFCGNGFGDGTNAPI